MTENLAIDLSYVDGAGNTIVRTFTSEDTDLTDHSLTGAYADGYAYDENTGITTWTPKDTAITSTIRGASAPNWANSNVYPNSANKVDDPSTGHESLGSYYNWTTAIASNNSTSKSSSTLNNITNNPQNSICPKGWRLPTISNQASTLPGSTNEFGRLNQLYNDGITSGTGSGTKLMKSPLWLCGPAASTILHLTITAPTATIGPVRSAIVASLTSCTLVQIAFTRPTVTTTTPAGTTGCLCAAWLSSHLSQPFSATLSLRKVNKTKIKPNF